MLDVGGRAGGALGEDRRRGRTVRGHGLSVRHLRDAVPESARPPDVCPICEDERQYVNPDGQKWTTLEDLRASHKNRIKKEEDRLYSINTEPKFGIGQRAFLIQTDGGNVLWDCVGLLDDATIGEDQRAGRDRRDRDLAPALLHVDGRMEPGVRRGADPPA